MNRQAIATFGVLCVVALALVALAGCTGAATSGGTTTPSTGGTSSGGTSGGVTVVESNYAFDPSAVSAKVGDVVTFKNEDSVPHHVMIGTTDLGEQAPGSSVTWTATAAGTFPFACSIHPSMTGEITVTQ